MITYCVWCGLASWTKQVALLTKANTLKGGGAQLAEPHCLCVMGVSLQPKDQGSQHCSPANGSASKVCDCVPRYLPR